MFPSQADEELEAFAVPSRRKIRSVIRREREKKEGMREKKNLWGVQRGDPEKLICYAHYPGGRGCGDRARGRKHVSKRGWERKVVRK